MHLFLHKYLDLSEGIEHGEGDGGSEQEIRQGKGEYEDVSDIIIIINQDILRRILVLLGIDQSPPIARLSPSKSPFLLIF